MGGDATRRKESIWKKAKKQRTVVITRKHRGKELASTE